MSSNSCPIHALDIILPASLSDLAHRQHRMMASIATAQENQKK